MSSDFPVYPDPVLIGRYEAALRAGVIAFVEAGAQGTVIVDVDSPLVSELERDWPDDFERQAAMWRIVRDVLSTTPEERDD
jgi:hypothetical protein